MEKKEGKQNQKMTIRRAGISAVLVIFFMAVGIIVYDADPQIPLAFSCLAAGFVAWSAGYRWEEILEGMTGGIARALEAILILLLIGMLVASWIAGGTVPALIHYGLRILSVRTFVPLAMAVTMILACALGSWGTLGTIGLAFMGIGRALGMPTGLVAGAVVSGAYMGGVLSPLSDEVNLGVAVARADLFGVVKRTSGPILTAFALSEIGYIILGLREGTGSAGIEGKVQPLLDSLNGSFSISLFSLIPLVLMILCILLKCPAIPSMFLGVICGIVEAVLLQGESLRAILKYEYSGYLMKSGNEMLDDLLSSGGIEEMLYTISIIIIAMAFGGLMQATGQMEALTSPLVRRIKGKSGLVNLTIVSCILSNILLPDQYMGIALPGQMYEEDYRKRSIDRTTLAAVLLCGGAVTSPLVPWNTCGIYVHSVLGVRTSVYAPFSLFSFVLPVVTCVWFAVVFAREKKTYPDHRENVI